MSTLPPSLQEREASSRTAPGRLTRLVVRDAGCYFKYEIDQFTGSVAMVRKRRSPAGDAMLAGTEPSALEKHRIPAIDRMMDVLGHLERRPEGSTIRDLVEMLGLPRTTVYRVLNSLQSHEMVRRSAD